MCTCCCWGWILFQPGLELGRPIGPIGSIGQPIELEQPRTKGEAGWQRARSQSAR